MTSSLLFDIKRPMSILVLMKELIAEKKNKNHRVSQRWIAARMNVSSGRLSEILRGKRTLSEAFLKKFCAALRLSNEDTQRLHRVFQNLDSENKKSLGPILSEAQVQSLADWKPFALMSFLQTTLYKEIKESCSTAQEQAAKMARQFNFPSEEVDRLLVTMVSARLIRWKGDAWQPLYIDASTGVDIPVESLRTGYIGHLKLAMEKIQTLGVAERDFSAVTLTMDPRDINKAKRMLRVFRRTFVKTMEKSAKRGVFQMNLQFFPLLDSEQNSNKTRQN